MIGGFVNEAIAMLAEGIPAASIEQASSQAGYPAPALQLTDELNMELMLKVRDATRAAGETEGPLPINHPAFDVMEAMIGAGRPGRVRGAGFYTYEDGKRVGLWIGSILGIGFPGWTGGVLQYINGYDAGLPGFVRRAHELALTYGERYAPPASLVQKAECGETYSDERVAVRA